LTAHFTPVAVKEEGTSPAHSVYVTHRHQHFPMLHIRDSKVGEGGEGGEQVTKPNETCSSMTIPGYYSIFKECI